MSPAPAHILANRDVTALGAFRTPARTAWLYIFDDVTKARELATAYRWAREKGLPVAVLGGGTNSVLCFDCFPGLIIHNKTRGWGWSSNSTFFPQINDASSPHADKMLWVVSGELVSPVCAQLKSKYANPVFEAWIGLPGTWGGAVFGNAGCFGLEMAHALVSAYVLDLETGKTRVVQAAEMGFAYRKSRLRDEPTSFVLSALFTVDTAKVLGWKPVESSLLERKARQPVNKPTCGSFFKNPAGDFAGRLIEAAGYKGYKIGGAQVAEKHANFFQNAGGATWQDILALRDAVKVGVKEKFGVELEEEARFFRAE